MFLKYYNPPHFELFLGIPNSVELWTNVHDGIQTVASIFVHKYLNLFWVLLSSERGNRCKDSSN